ncbi:MAG: dihydropteroate synthase [Meiothermus sp.]
MRLDLREHGLDLSRVRLMGILNLTPDSFSDGGKYLDPQAALARARQMVAEGADLLDLGGESTRPGALPVPPEEERRRVLPVLEAVQGLGVPISIDTRKPEVAAEALAMGAHLLNDVTGLRDERMIELCARYQVPAVIVHMPVPDPLTMQQHTGYADVVGEVKAFLAAQAQRALAAGVPQVVLDPGFGFGKELEGNLELVRHLDQLVALGHPVLLGASRKRTIGELSRIENPQERVVGSVAMHLYGVMKGARILRVHDVRAHREALAVWEALGQGGVWGGSDCAAGA